MKRIRHISNQSDSAEKRLPDFQDENVPRSDPFPAPENYFDELPQRIMDRISADVQKQHENPRQAPLLRRLWMAAAAIAAIAVIFMILKPANIVPTTNSPIVNSTGTESLSVDYNQTYTDEALLLEENEITDKDISAINLKTMDISLNSSDTTSVAASEIIKYLLDENYDTDLLAEL